MNGLRIFQDLIKPLPSRSIILELKTIRILVMKVPHNHINAQIISQTVIFVAKLEIDLFFSTKTIESTCSMFE